MELKGKERENPPLRTIIKAKAKKFLKETEAKESQLHYRK
jgi:hypothetical protein